MNTKTERGLAQAIANKLDGEVIGESPDGWDLCLSGGWAGLIATSGRRRLAISITASEIPGSSCGCGDSQCNDCAGASR